MVKHSPANAGDARDAGWIPGLGRSPGRGHGTQLLYSCLENPMDRGSWWATLCGAAESDTIEQLNIPQFLILFRWTANLKTGILEATITSEAVTCRFWGSGVPMGYPHGPHNPAHVSQGTTASTLLLGQGWIISMIRTVNLQTFTPSELTSCLFKYIFKISLFISNCGKIHIKFTILTIQSVYIIQSCLTLSHCRAANLWNSFHLAEREL